MTGPTSQEPTSSSSIAAMSRPTKLTRPRSRQVELVSAQDAPARRTRSRTTTTVDHRGIDGATSELSAPTSLDTKGSEKFSLRRHPARALSLSLPSTTSSSLALYTLPAMPRTPPPAPSQDSIRDFVGYFAGLSTPRRNQGSGETGPTSKLNQSAVSASTTSTETTDSVDTASPSVAAPRRTRPRRRNSSPGSDTSATLSVSTTTQTTTTAEEESRVERELTVTPHPPPSRPHLRVRLTLRRSTSGEDDTETTSQSGASKRAQEDDQDDDEDYVESPKVHARQVKKWRANRVTSPVEENQKPVVGRRKGRSRLASTAPGSRESTASIGSVVPRSSHGRNTRSSTLVAEPVQTLESVEAANKALDDRLRQIGLRVVNVASDGNCLFRVFAHQLFNDPSRHSELRAAICDYLKTHADTLSCYNWNEHGESYEQYVARMRKSRVWGGYLELYAFTQLYACRLIIYEADREQVFGDGNDVPPDARVVRLSYHGGVHYNSVVPATSDNDEASPSG